MAIGLSLLASTTAFAAATFSVTPLIADRAGKAPNVDPDMKNPWGISQFPGGDLWVSDNRTGVSTIYDSVTGVKNSLIVTTPGEKHGRKGRPTGQVAMPSGHGFVITGTGGSGESIFVFATEDGQIEGWNPNVDGTNAIVAFQDSGDKAPKHGREAAYYTGIAWDQTTNHLFLTDFVNNSIDIFDNAFRKNGRVHGFQSPKGICTFQCRGAQRPTVCDLRQARKRW